MMNYLKTVSTSLLDTAQFMGDVSVLVIWCWTDVQSYVIDIMLSHNSDCS